MKLRVKKVFFVLGGILTLFILALSAYVLFADINAYKPRIEAAASRAIGMDVRINGKMRLVLFPGLGISLRNVGVRNAGADLLSLEGVRIGLGLIPLLKREFRIRDIELAGPRLSIERRRDGTFNFGKPGEKPEKESRVPSFAVARFSISKGELSYLDKKSGSRTEMKGLDLILKSVAISEGRISALPENISFTGEAKCSEIIAKNFRITNLTSSLKGESGTYTVSPLTMEIFKGTGKGSISLNLKAEPSVFAISGAVAKFSFADFFATFSRKKVIEGKTDLSVDLSAKGRDINELKRAIRGEVSLKGSNLILEQLDLDTLLSQYEKSQSFNLVDVGAFLFAGPLGATLTKGYDFAGVYRESLGGRGTIGILVSNWAVRSGVAQAKDVAFTTRKNRIALKGSLDFINERFDDVTVAVLDEKGCARFSQKIRGAFRNPKIDKPSTLQSVAGPVLKLFEKTREFVTRGRCEVFYSGSLAHPK